MSASGIGVPFFVGDVLYVPTEDGKVSAYDIKNRKLKWRRQFSSLIVAPMTLGPNEIYLCDSNNTVYALKQDSGEVIWQYQHRSQEDPRSLISSAASSGTSMFSLHGEASPLLNDGTLFVGYSDGRVRAFDALSGTTLWVRDLAPQLNRFEDVDADFALVGDTLYAASAASGLYALSASSGEVRWFYPLAGVVTLSPFEGDLILGMQHGELGRFSTFNRSFNWRVKFGTDGVPLRPVRFPHGLAVSVSRGGLYVLDVHTGELRDQFSPGSGMQGALALSTDGWLYATSLNGFLYAFSPR
jgi:outer membrane protein assembly factor BamB